jgi:hypothetical protein
VWLFHCTVVPSSDFGRYAHAECVVACLFLVLSRQPALHQVNWGVTHWPYRMLAYWAWQDL